MEEQLMLAGIELKLYRLLITMNFQGETYACLSYTADYERKKHEKKLEHKIRSCTKIKYKMKMNTTGNEMVNQNVHYNN